MDYDKFIELVGSRSIVLMASVCGTLYDEAETKELVDEAISIKSYGSSGEVVIDDVRFYVFKLEPVEWEE